MTNYEVIWETVGPVGASVCGLLSKHDTMEEAHAACARAEAEWEEPSPSNVTSHYVVRVDTDPHGNSTVLVA